MTETLTLVGKDQYYGHGNERLALSAFQLMFREAKDRLHFYEADLLHDIDVLRARLKEAPEDSDFEMEFSWYLRDMGTHIFPSGDEPRFGRPENSAKYFLFLRRKGDVTTAYLHK
jgi:hypothetical protein